MSAPFNREVYEETEYLVFRRQDIAGRRTPIIEVSGKRTGYMLGEIRWFAPWRCFTLHPMRNTVWNRVCLEDVNRVIDKLNAERQLTPTS
jgi:hypothetical protein